LSRRVNPRSEDDLPGVSSPPQWVGSLRSGARSAGLSATTGPDAAAAAPPMPPSIELAWGLREHPRRGPKPGLSLARIVAAGIKVAATEGLGGLSMGRVASELGVATMALYRHVSAKDELLTLMVDAAIGPAPALEDSGGDWRAGLTRWAQGVRAAYRRNPWALRVPIGAPPLGPNNVAWLESALRVLAPTRLAEYEKASTVLLLSFYVRSEATLMADIAAASGAEQVAAYDSLLTMLTDAVHFPAIHRAVAGGAFRQGGPDGYFNYGLGRILDGIEKLAGPSPAVSGEGTRRIRDPGDAQPASLPPRTASRRRGVRSSPPDRGARPAPPR